MNSRTKWSRVWWGLASFKAGYFIAILLALNFWGDLGEFVRLPQRWPRQGGPTFASHFAGWDAGYYLSLSEDGYTAGDQACAFYPLWPLLIRWFSVLTGGNHLIAGMVLANVFSLAAWIIFYHVAARRFGEKTAWWALVLLIIFPGSLFYQFIYSEPLFFLLVMVLWLGLEQNRYGLAWSAAFLLPLTRGIGIFAVLPIAWHAFEPAGAWFKNRVGQAVRRFGPGWKSILLWGRTRCDGRNGVQNDTAHSCVVFPVRNVAERAWLLAVPLAGWATYLALMDYWTGNPFEGFQAQKHWGVHSIGNLFNAPKFVIGLFSSTEWHAFTGSLLDRCTFILLLFSLPVIWRLDKGLLVWTYVLGILPAMSGTFTSFTRFAAVSFPMFTALGEFLARPEWRWLRYGLFALFGVLHVVLIWRYVNCRWAG